MLSAPPVCVWNSKYNPLFPLGAHVEHLPYPEQPEHLPRFPVLTYCSCSLPGLPVPSLLEAAAAAPHLYTTAGMRFHERKLATLSSSLSVIQAGTMISWG